MAERPSATTDDDALAAAPPSRARDTAGAVVTGSAIVAVVALVNFGSIPAGLTTGQLIIAVIAVGAAVEALRWVRRGVRDEARRVLAREIAEYGGGLYGSVALATFVWLNAVDLFGDITAAGSFSAFLAAISLGWLIAEAIEALGFAIRAAFWPWHWFAGHGALLPWVVAGSVAIVDIVRRPVRRWWARRREVMSP